MDSLLPSCAVDFRRPIEILDDCHRRIRDQSATIAWLTLYMDERGADEHAANTARAVVSFFDTVAAAHHIDEECDLYPLVQRFCASTELNAVRSLVARLRADHRTLDAFWADMRPRLLAVVAGDAGALTADAAASFSKACHRHIALEESEMMPLARRVLDGATLSRLGSSMARRRETVSR